MGDTGRRAVVAGLCGLAGLAGCGRGGVSGIVGGPVPGHSTAVALDPPAPGSASTTPAPATGATTVPGGSPTAPGATAAAPTPPSTPAAPPAPAPAPGGMRLDGDDLGVTRVGAPFREAVGAVAVALGRPTGDPAADTSCVGAEDETTWGSFRLASSGGRVSGWLSTSTSLGTAAGVRVGTTLAALGQAYGSRLDLPPPAPDSGTIFLVPGAQLAGTLTGPAPTDTVTSISNGTCKPR